MSRMYRVRISESVTKLVHVGDAVASDLEMLPILARERMLELLAGELTQRGFARDGGVAKREEERGVVVTVDLATGRVTAQVATSEEVTVQGEHEVRTPTPQIQRATEEWARKKLQNELGGGIEQREKELQAETTRRLEARLRDLRGEMDQVVNRVTIDALKERAGQLGEIEELHEDAETGELTIKVKV